MGCGASNERDGEQPREKHASTGPPKRHNTQQTTSGGAANNTAAPNNDDKYRTHGDHQDTETTSISNEGLSETTTMLSQAVLVELRQKSSKETGSSVMRWVDSITVPGEVDNPDVYDPLKRHHLAMESLRQKQSVSRD